MLQPLDQEGFARLDYQVMRCAFDSQNQLGRLCPRSAFRLTALPEGTAEYEPQLRALLEHSSLETLQWVNLARHRVQLITLDKAKG